MVGDVSAVIGITEVTCLAVGNDTSIMCADTVIIEGEYAAMIWLATALCGIV